MKTIGIIPARYASTRLPGKPMIKIGGIPMIELVYRQAIKCKSLDEVVVATDDQRIFEHIKQIGGTAMMTSSSHLSGTDRLGEVSQKHEGALYINIQGDEPFLAPKIIDNLVIAMKKNNWPLGSLYYKISDNEELFNPNAIKVILNTNSEAIYFSRQTIPYQRNQDKENWMDKHSYYKHIGIYAYRHDILQKIIKLKPSSLELCESLEQLRWLENGYKIGMVPSNIQTLGIDTKEDLEKAEIYILNNKENL